MPADRCPCCSNRPYSECCQPYLGGAAEAPDPEALMRSRYTAFTRGDLAYLKKTWHPETVPDLTGDEPSNWVSLQILETALDESGDFGEVEFVAKLVIENRLETLHEVSEFERVEGQWLYCAGEFKNDPEKYEVISMKAPCPCGSGEKFKHCHYRKSV